MDVYFNRRYVIDISMKFDSINKLFLIVKPIYQTIKQNKFFFLHQMYNYVVQCATESYFCYIFYI